MPRYSIAGLSLEAPFILHALPLAPSERPDVRLDRTPPTVVPLVAPKGELLGGLTRRTHSSFLARDARGFTYRLGGAMDCRIASDTSSAWLSLDPRLDPEFAAIFTSSGLTSLIAALRDAVVFHAGAVRWRGRTVAVIGHSGEGKSTLLTLLCASGAELLTEDALRIDMLDGVCWGYAGAQELRLRPQAAGLAERFDKVCVRTSVDGRIVVTPPSVAERKVQVDAFVLPNPSRGSTDLRVSVLPELQAICELLERPRVLSLDSPEFRARRFREATRIGRAIPVLQATIPWGPPFAIGLASALWDRLEQLGRSAAPQRKVRPAPTPSAPTRPC